MATARVPRSPGSLLAFTAVIVVALVGSLVAVGAVGQEPQPPTSQAASPPATASPPAQPALSDAQIEEFLKTAKLVRSKSAGKGVTNSLRATYTDGTLTHDVHVQTVEERKTTGPSAGGTEMNFRDSWMFNIAGYKLDRLIGMYLVPVSIERRWQTTPAAYTWWIDDVMMDEGGRLQKKLQPARPADWNEQMQMVRVFDQLIYNMDRNLGNLLITNDWNVWAIDHTRAFRLHKTLKTPENITRCDRQMFERLKQLNKEALTSAMGSYLTTWEIDALLARRDLIVERLEKAGPGALFNRRDGRGPSVVTASAAAVH